MTAPGILFVLRGLTHQLAPPLAIVYTARYALEVYFSVTIPPVLFWLTLLASVPLLWTANLLWSDHAERREASAMGAEAVPVWNGKWPGNLDLLNSLMAKFKLGYPCEGFWEAYVRFGAVFNIRIFWTNQIFTIEPDHIKTVLATEFAHYEKGGRTQSIMRSVLGTGVFNSDGEMWKFHRTMTRPFFSRDRISHFDLFERHADDAIVQMKQRFHEGYAIDFQDVMSRFTLDSASEFLFGSCVHSLASGLPYPANTDAGTSKRPPSQADHFARAFAEAQSGISARMRLAGLWPFFELFRDRTKEPMAVVSAYLDPILKEALEKKRLNETVGISPAAKAEGDVDDGDTLLDHLVKYTDDITILKDETLNIMIAGRDTTASTLTFVAYFLAMYPHTLGRLRAEILAKVGSSRRPTYDDIREMKYLRAVINETLRLFPPVPMNIRDSIEAMTLSPVTPGGKPLHVPAGTSVSYSVFMMHRRTDLWGPDALEFDPDRFLDERLHRYLTPNPFIFLPFNAGPRICLGQQFAYNEVSFMLVRLLQNFDAIALDASAQPPGSKIPAYWAKEGGRQAIEQFFPKMHLTMYAHEGLWLKMREANDGEQNGV